MNRGACDTCAGLAGLTVGRASLPAIASRYLSLAFMAGRDARPSVFDSLISMRMSVADGTLFPKNCIFLANSR